MSCVTDSCAQGRKPCPTPGICTGEANLRRVMEQQIGRDIGEPQGRADPIVTPPQLFTVLESTLICAVAVLAIACAVAPSLF